ncbi:MAG: glycosyltransferase family 4 protein [Pirellula staleyi]
MQVQANSVFCVNNKTRCVPLLFAHSSHLVGGANKVLLRLIEKLDRRRFQPMSVIPAHGPLEAELIRLQTPYAVVDVRSANQSMWLQGLSRLQLFLQLRHQRPMLIHANEMAYRTVASACVGANRICHIHHPNVEAALLSWALGKVPHRIITPSNFMQEHVMNALQQAEIRSRVDRVWNPIDTEHFCPAPCAANLRRQLEMNPNTFHVAIVGALAPHKGHVCFLRMAREVLSVHPETTFHIIGGDMGRHPGYAALLNVQIQELGIGNRVRFWGFASDDTVKDAIAASDLFVLPSIEEGFGLVLAEAQSCEVPVLASKIPPLGEVVDDGRTGYLLDPSDPSAFATKAIDLLNSLFHRREMGKAGRRWVKERFCLNSIVSQVAAIYEDVLTQRHESNFIA